MDKLLREAQEWEVKSSSNRGPVSAAESQYSSDKNDFNESLLDGTTGSQAAAMEPPVIVPPVIEEEEPLEPLGLIVNPDGKPQVAHDDPYLGPFIDDLYLRQNEYKKWLEIFQGEGGLLDVARTYNKFGLHKNEKNEIVLQEWAPSAKGIAIFGDFNGWNRDEFWCTRNDFGCWCITLPPLEDGSPRI